MGGSNIPELHAVMGTEHVKFMLQHTRTNTQSMAPLNITLDWHQLCAGLGSSLWEEVLAPIELHVPTKWFNLMQIFLRELDPFLQIPHARCSYPCNNDSAIVENTLKWTQNMTTLKMINNCHLHSQILCWSDITNAVGDELKE